ncbi:N-acetyltransferase [uncultured Tateyamaria sp.]|uniref:GNAT family N-acetyltransferase n=1 Tax=uncultured Tateyamaria sp. TaxID=455651 RepID=UPI002610FA88|nr:GNAT family N-acetyltransferase [uncultured Tateyamaria sp.]
MTPAIETSTDATVIGPILRLLRSGLEPALFERRLAEAIANGYRAFVTQDRSACLGFHITHDVYWGKTFYIDDLVVHEQRRSSGIGAALLDHARTEARALGCDHLRLCSGLRRADAHRFYERNGLARTSLQFATSVQESTP